MIHPARQTLQCIASHFGIQSEPYYVLLDKPQSITIRLGDDPGYVLRVSRKQTPSMVELEIAFLKRLRDAGFDRLPSFRRGVDGDYALVLDDQHATASVYRFIPGKTNQPLLDAQFDHILTVLPEFLHCMARTMKSDMLLTLSTTRTLRGLALARTLLQRTNDPLQLLPYLETADPEVLDCLSGEQVVHGDLHAGNLVWNSQDRLAAIIDFEYIARGSLLSEIFPILTSLPFRGTELDLERLARLLDLFGRSIKPTVGAGQFIQLYVLTALGFFGHVNRNAKRSGLLEWRDAKRARALLDEQDRIKELLALA